MATLPHNLRNVTVVPTVSVMENFEALALKGDLSDPTLATNGAGMVAYREPGANRVNRTLYALSNDSTSFKNYGAVGDNSTNNAGFLASYLADGGDLFVPDGVYGFTAATSQSYGAISGIGSQTRRYNIVGASRNNTIFWYSSTGYWLTSVGGYATEGIHSFDTIENLSLISANTRNNNAILYSQKAYVSLKKLHLNGFSEAIRLTACFTSDLEEIYARDNNYGLIFGATAFPDAANAITLRRFTGQLCTNFAIFAEGLGESNIFDGGTVEDCGIQGNANTGGIYLLIDKSNGQCVSEIRGYYFELNKGGADIYIENKGTKHAVVTISNCFFNRALAAQWTTNNIKIRNTGTGRLTVVVKGCGFNSTDTYVPSAARPFFDVGAGCELQDGGGNTFSEATSLPYAPANRFSANSFGLYGEINTAGTVAFAGPDITCSKPSAGVYELTHAKGWAADVQGYFPTAICNDNGGARKVKRVTKNNASTFTVVVEDNANALADGSFAFFVTRNT